jgi:fructose-1,6-bisphosphatase/inositol monophosphatase family enzyme
MLILILLKESDLTESDLTQAFDFAKTVAKDAAVIMKRYFQAADIGTELKEDESPVTLADHTINTMVIEKIKTHYPKHGVIGEEGSYEEKREWVWVTDPVDGTSPFVLGIPISTFCLALVHKGDVLLSVVYDPFQDRLFSARKGHGAYLNDIKLSVSNKDSFRNQAVQAFRSMTTANHKGVNHMFDNLQKQGAKIYNFPSFSFAGALVAEGRFIAACMLYGSPWDAAAISLIVQEAGGVATDVKGRPRKYNDWADGLVLSNGKVHQQIIDLIDYENTRD